MPEQVVLSEIREPDGGRVSVRIHQRFTLSSDLSLEFRAYYESMPIELNHSDDARWTSGAAGRAVMDAARAIASDSSLLAELRQVPDDEAEGTTGEPRVYRLTLHHPERGDGTWVTRDGTGRAFRMLDSAYTSLVRRFESETGRPPAPGELPH